MKQLTRLVRQVGVDTGYVLTGLTVALPAFVVVFSLTVVGLVLSITVLGLPALGLGVYAARAFADLERVLLPSVVHRPTPRPRYRKPPPGAGWWRRVTTPLRDGQSWLDLVHAVFGWILMTISFVFVLTWWSAALGGLTAFIWNRYIPHEPGNQTLYDVLGKPAIPGGEVGMYTFAGIFFLLTLPLITRTFALLPAQFGRVMLTGIAEVQDRITGLEEQRDSAVSAEATALRRLERDIHDGPQQRLVRLAMDLSRAKQQLAADPAAAQATIDEALGQTRETLDELRALSRGIAPPILADRGLTAALAALGSRSTVPVGLTVSPDLGRLAPITESTAYFVVAEALTNVAKHSEAGSCGVDVVRVDRRLRITVVDDGVGGAHVAKGHGLSGLADRVRAAGGTLAVHSPVGGPTEIEAELPCG